MENNIFLDTNNLTQAGYVTPTSPQRFQRRANILYEPQPITELRAKIDKLAVEFNTKYQYQFSDVIGEEMSRHGDFDDDGEVSHALRQIEGCFELLQQYIDDFSNFFNVRDDEPPMA